MPDRMASPERRVTPAAVSPPVHPVATAHPPTGTAAPQASGDEDCDAEKKSWQGNGVHATARIRAEHNGRATTLPLLHSDGPFHLRRLRPAGRQARVSVIGAMSAPLGGDRLALDITARPRAELEVTTGAATIALRGCTTTPASYDVHLTADENASLNWLPQPLISTRGSTLHQTYTVDLAATSRLLLREEQLLGRTAEPPGHLTTRLTVRRAGRLILDQHTAYGAPASAWDGPAVLGGHRACGQLLVVTPEPHPMDRPVHLSSNPADGYAVLAPLADSSALLATAIAPTASRLRLLLDSALAKVACAATGTYDSAL